MTDFSALADWLRFWPYAVALPIGAATAVIDSNVFGRYVLGALLVLSAAGGAIGMKASPFTFYGSDYYMESLIAAVAALIALAGYAMAVAARLICSSMCRKTEPAA